MLLSPTFSILLLQAASSLAIPGSVVKRADPVVQLDDTTVTGIANGTVNQFLGIPFAQPPVGSLRFQLPRPLPSYNESFPATAYGPVCPQQAFNLTIPSDLPAETQEVLEVMNSGSTRTISEDCLSLNVIAPANASVGSKHPVIVWIFGGGFEAGDPAATDGSVIVNKSIDLGVPVVYVSINYRTKVLITLAFGFLAGKEVQEAGIGNLGLQDQRLALKWIQRYIGQFGGDPSKVTIWGESAGAISVALQMVTNSGNAEGLFRAAFMQSGSPIPVGDIAHGQVYYDSLVNQTGCSNSSDTLKCLRGVPYDTLMDAVNNTPNIFSYQSLSLAWLPRVDGIFLTDDPQQLVLQGSVADVPFVTGDCNDEGTIFSFANLNVTTDDEFLTYIQMYYTPGASVDEVKQILDLYPQDPADGSPFNTSDQNALTPQSKRLAAFQGDAIFQGPRRSFLQQRAGKQETWSFCNKQSKALPYLGSYHGSDMESIWGDGAMSDYFLRFVTNLDPNGNTSINWPRYTLDSPNMLTLLDGSIPLQITQDDYRVEAMRGVSGLMLKYPL
ncbi:alpha beta-hydrolase [Coniophora puteana RWD-64-598 SS2]|uniref:Carboxylic ester hydrolase n=1 Tax=Coniophora puteana (strain RWD-64-598) TaxID=741705 RepID=A0A5M3MQS9_CONPW|nr:alpha beta-hydrolase [Coniophora puteana RWD-64-598 SS2]EIW81539.1 alpha beta-hydrolase [Coniophora puteana RWD-64-598 SS2]